MLQPLQPTVRAVAGLEADAVLRLGDPQPSPDGRWLVYGSKRDGVRQLYAMRLADKKERRITDLKKGHAAMWPHWQSAKKRG